jgi:hypothetical protein
VRDPPVRLLGSTASVKGGGRGFMRGRGLSCSWQTGSALPMRRGHHDGRGLHLGAWPKLQLGK